jgi:GntP family gluconate:H+ symporter
LILYLRVNAFLALIVAALLLGLLSDRVILGPPDEAGVRDVVLSNSFKQVAQSFGEMMARIGIVIALATIIGKAMMDSGAAERIVQACIRLFGERLTPLALLVSSYVLGIPVFFDTVFLLMAPLAKALYQRTGKNYLLYITAIAAGASITHSLVPPTPGPLTAAATLKVDLGETIIIGMIVAAPLALAGLVYGAMANRWWPAAPRLSSVTAEPAPSSQLPERRLPSLFLALMPILLPVVLISSQTAFRALAKEHPTWNLQFELQGWNFTLSGLLDFIGEPNFALLVSAVASMGLVVRQRRMSRQELGKFTASALDEAGMILLITCAGGAFGAMLEKIGVGESIGTLAKEWGVPLLVLAWGMTALLKAAQGSATVAMIVSAKITLGILLAETGKTEANLETEDMISYLGYHPVYLVMAIGCGSKIGSWLNDSGFWVVCKMGGLSETETLRSWTLVLVTMGLVGLPVTWLLSIYLPLT